jgi:hypothetical protein
MELAQIAAMGWFAKALGVSALLGVPDLLADGPLSAEAIAELTGTDPDATLRLMQTVALMGMYTRGEDGRFANGPQAEQLRSDHPRSMRYFTVLASGLYDKAWGGLEHTVRTGKPAFATIFGSTIYDYLDNEPEQARIYDLAMADLARPVAAELAKNYDFSAVQTVIDIGGGAGALLKAVLAELPDLTGVVADRATVCAAATPTDRLSFQPCDFFESVPTGGDRYVLKNVLHNWSVDSCRRILTTIATTMRAATNAPRLLVIEPLVERDENAWRALFQMVVCEDGTNGLNNAKLAELLNSVGLEILSTNQLGQEHTIFECAAITQPDSADAAG